MPTDMPPITTGSDVAAIDVATTSTATSLIFPSHTNDEVHLYEPSNTSTVISRNNSNSPPTDSTSAHSKTMKLHEQHLQQQYVDEVDKQIDVHNYRNVHHEKASQHQLQQKSITVTIHLSSSPSAREEVNSTSSTNHSSTIPSSMAETDVVRDIIIPILALEKRENEMIQTARTLNIPTSRWNGSLLYGRYQKQITADQAAQNGNDASKRIVLHIYQDSLAKWSIRNNSGKAPCTDNISSICAGKWFGTRIHQNIDFDWIQTYYITGRIMIPSTARGFDVLWLLEYFHILYQPDQCHFANYAVYERVQLWTKYYCYVRPILVDWIVNRVMEQKQEDDENHSSFPLFFGTTSSTETCVDLGTERLWPLGDVTPPSTLMTKITGRSKLSMADMAIKFFNSSSHTDPSAKQQYQNQDGTASCTDETQTTIPCPEECTASEMRHDFCNFLMHHFSENDSYLIHVMGLKHKLNVQFDVRPVTIHCNYEQRNNRAQEETTTSNSNSSGSFPAFHESDDGTKNSSKHNKLLHQYKIVHRAVLMIDIQPIPTKTESPRPSPCLKPFCSKSDLIAPVDELVEEEIAKGHLEELLLQVESRNNISIDKSGRRVTINEHLSFENETNRLPTGHDKVSGQSPSLTLVANGTTPNLIELNVPHDELNASMDTTSASANALMGLFPATSVTKKRKKPKPVFELPEKLLVGDSEDMLHQNQSAPQLARTKHPIVKTSAIVGQTGQIGEGLVLPGPITIVRRGTYDNTVTSALTGPFYLDENGILRDVFENCGPDSDEEYDGDEDTRAQARRHEWIQAALMNRGIGERMESLLKEGETTKNANANFDPWDWFTGLNVCEFSREVLKSVEQYASSVVHDSYMGVNPNPATKAMNSASPVTPDNTSPPQNEEVVLSSHLLNIQTRTTDFVNYSELEQSRGRSANGDAEEEQSREDETYDRVERKIVLPTDVDNREDSSRSHGSKESPRGVLRFDSDLSSGKLLAPSFGDVAHEQISGSTAEITQPPPTPKKKNRGIKGLFRRKKIDPTVPKKECEHISK